MQFIHFRAILIAYFICLISTSSLYAQWNQLGTNQGFASNASLMSMAFHPTANEPYIAYADGALNSYIVKRYNGTAWVQVGANVNAAGNNGYMEIAFNTTGELYAAFRNPTANAFTIKKFDGTNWVQVGTNQGFASSMGGCVIEFNPATNEPYIAYPDGSANAFVIKRFTAGAWTQVGTNQGFASSGTNVVSLINIKFSPADNEPYIAYRDGASNAFVIKRFTGGAWTQVGANLSFASSESNCEIKFHPATKEAYVGYREGASNAFQVRRFTAGTWTLVGSLTAFAGSTSNVSLDFEKLSGEPYVAIRDGAANAFSVRRFTAGAWTAVGSNIGFAGNYANAVIHFHPTTNEIYLAYPDGAANAFIIRKNITTTLPLSFIAFTASAGKEKVLLEWTTANEVNTHHFIAEKSTDGIHYTQAGIVAAKNGKENHYSFNDYEAYGNLIYYRIKQVDQDGQYSYSKTLLVKKENQPEVKLYPNPATDNIYISGIAAGDVITVWNVLGARIYQTKAIHNVERIAVKGFTKGSYTVVINTANGSSVRSFMVQ